MLKSLERILVGAILASGVIWTFERNLEVKDPYDIAGKIAAITLAVYLSLTIYNNYKRKE